MRKTKNENIEAVRSETEFSKNQLLHAKRFLKRRDLLNALLTDGKKYTIQAVEEKIENFMKGKVE